ncbi:thiol:disulfide interchange protein DsbA/DsbL [Pseudomonadota bacterium]
MKKFFGVLALVVATQFSQAAAEDGAKYQTIANPQPTADTETIEVLELFWYGCPHCYHLEPEIEAWLETKPDDVTFVRMPAILGPTWELGARAFYTAELLDVTDKIHAPLFERLHKDKKPLRSAADIKAFFVKQGVSAEDFDKTFNSFAVITKTNRAKQARDMYGITGVPALVVNGKYRTTARLAGGDRQMLEVVNVLIEQERNAGKAAAAE